jgi:hypothetical protein
MNSYLYGVIPGGVELPDDIKGIGGRPVEVVMHRDVAAVLGPFDGDQVAASRQNLSAHSTVAEALMQYATILPVRFGLLFADRAGVVEEFLKPHQDELASLLRQLAGQQEFRVQARYLPDVVVHEAVAHQPSIVRLQARLRGKPADATYFDRIRLGEKVVEIVDAIKNRDGTRLLASLAGTAVEHRTLPARSDTVALSAAFLVDTRRRRRFDDAVGKLATEQEDRMTFRVVGPLPPWDFVDLDLGEAVG